MSVILAACTYEPNNEFVSTIEPPEELDIAIEVNDPNFTDPYILLEDETFQFTLKDLSKPILDVEVTVGGFELPTFVDKNKITFNVDPYSLNGTLEVRMNIIIATQSRSLAESLGAEYYQLSPTFKVIVDRNPPTLSDPVSAAYENGYLTLRWKAPGAKNFRYTLMRQHADSQVPFNSFLHKIATIDPLKEHFIDSGYVGGAKTYKLLADGVSFSKELAALNFSEPAHDLKIIRAEQSELRAQWSYSKLSPVGLNLRVTTSANIGSYDGPFEESGDINIGTLPLGRTTEVYTIISNPNYPSQAHSSTQKLGIPNLHVNGVYRMMPDQDKLLVTTNEAIYRYKLSTLALEESILASAFGVSHFITLVTSRNGQYGAVSGIKKIIIFDPLNFANKSMVDLATATAGLTPGGGTIVQATFGQISNSGILPITLQNTELTYPLLFNLNSRTVSWIAPDSLVARFGGTGCLISPDDTYLIVHHPPLVFDNAPYQDVPWSIVHMKSGDTYQPVGRVKKFASYFGEGNELISLTQPPVSDMEIVFYNIDAAPGVNMDYTILRSLSVPSTTVAGNRAGVAYDYHTNKLYTVFRSNGKSTLTVINASTFATEKVGYAFDDNFHVHSYSNNYHLLSSGYIEELK